MSTRSAAYAAVSAVDTFVGNNNGPPGGVFTGGGIDALAPDADGNGGYAALSALPVFAGTGGVFTGGGVAALSGYDALSAIPAYLDDPPATASTLAASGGGAATPGGGTTTTPSVRGWRRRRAAALLLLPPFRGWRRTSRKTLR